MQKKLFLILFVAHIIFAAETEQDRAAALRAQNNPLGLSASHVQENLEELCEIHRAFQAQRLKKLIQKVIEYEFEEFTTLLNDTYNHYLMAQLRNQINELGEELEAYDGPWLENIASLPGAENNAYVQAFRQAPTYKMIIAQAEYDIRKERYLSLLRQEDTFHTAAQKMRRLIAVKKMQMINTLTDEKAAVEVLADRSPEGPLATAIYCGKEGEFFLKSKIPSAQEVYGDTLENPQNFFPKNPLLHSFDQNEYPEYKALCDIHDQYIRKQQEKLKNQMTEREYVAHQTQLAHTYNESLMEQWDEKILTTAQKVTKYNTRWLTIVKQLAGSWQKPFFQHIRNMPNSQELINRHRKELFSNRYAQQLQPDDSFELKTEKMRALIEFKKRFKHAMLPSFEQIVEVVRNHTPETELVVAAYLGQDGKEWLKAKIPQTRKAEDLSVLASVQKTWERILQLPQTATRTEALTFLLQNFRASTLRLFDWNSKQQLVYDTNPEHWNPGFGFNKQTTPHTTFVHRKDRKKDYTTRAFILRKPVKSLWSVCCKSEIDELVLEQHDPQGKLVWSKAFKIKEEFASQLPQIHSASLAGENMHLIVEEHAQKNNRVLRYDISDDGSLIDTKVIARGWSKDEFKLLPGTTTYFKAQPVQ